jgi:4-hydroxy-tetrahydrodipicolinate synthase
MKAEPRLLHGIFTALAGLMDRHGEVCLKKLAAFVVLLLHKGIHGLSTLGTTGESSALSTPEREAVLRTVSDAVAGREPTRNPRIEEDASGMQRI